MRCLSGRIFSGKDIFALARNMALKVKLIQNIARLWIIAPSENQHLAWSGLRWVPIDRDGLSLSELKVAIFATAIDAAAYAQDNDFEIEHG